MANKKKIAVIASRLKSQNAVSVEADKWIDTYLKLGYDVHVIAGKIGEPMTLPHLVIPEMDYKHSEVRGVKRILFGANLDKAGLKASNILLNNLVHRIKPQLKKYLMKNKIDIISVEGVLGDVANVPLSVALAKIIHELGIPTISRYHKFFWEDKYFNSIEPKILGGFPPAKKNIIHITNSTTAQTSLMNKKNIRSVVIPHTIDFDKIQGIDEYNKDFRRDFEIRKDQLIFLQPTKIIRKKCVERSIKLVHEINEATRKDHVLMLTGPATYFRGNYFEEIVRRAKKLNVNVILAHDRVFLERHENKERKFYSIWDAYAHADFVMYPSTSGGFGNPVIEAVAHKKPVIVNSHEGIKDILDKGFTFITLDQKLTPENVSDTYELAHDKKKRDAIVDKNYAILQKHFSSDVLDDALIPLLNKLEHEDFFTKVFKKFGMKKNDNDPLKNKKGGYKDPK